MVKQEEKIIKNDDGKVTSIHINYSYSIDPMTTSKISSSNDYNHT